MQVCRMDYTRQDKVLPNCVQRNSVFLNPQRNRSVQRERR